MVGERRKDEVPAIVAEPLWIPNEWSIPRASGGDPSLLSWSDNVPRFKRVLPHKRHRNEINSNRGSTVLRRVEVSLTQ